MIKKDKDTRKLHTQTHLIWYEKEQEINNEKEENDKERQRHTKVTHTHTDSYNMEKEEKINNENGERNRDRKKDVEYNEW